MFYLHVRLCTMHAFIIQSRQIEGTRSPWNKSFLTVVLEINPGPVQEPQMIWTADSSQIQQSIFKNLIFILIINISVCLCEWMPSVCGWLISPGTGIIKGSVHPYVGAVNWTQIFWKSNNAISHRAIFQANILFFFILKW